MTIEQQRQLRALAEFRYGEKRNDALKRACLNGMLCSVCDRPQYFTPSGPVCDEGHGGADPGGMLLPDTAAESKVFEEAKWNYPRK